ncbi:pilus assembly protein N-terminal domain-containing protein [Variovorax sp. J22G73]|uniref:type II and III secretion system protein family protein n=1 Tax=unclassified Variovorax TaxID=663243 RepID=UPI0025749370|nr:MULTISPECIES: pilus assembly protein N-terminal domain-containing protein [unclassified Variovorax]MDM0009254.1 pilus assembly protein N-terminal domain-containing protein [Variovorax sp. J22R203]MDM0101810.1 pilus assembly protein N-terminal domain-containing protein [Variovorax sp. J22G73]
MNLKRCGLAAVTLVVAFQGVAHGQRMGGGVGVEGITGGGASGGASGGTLAAPGGATVPGPGPSPASGGVERSPGIRPPPPPPPAIDAAELQRIAARATVLQELPSSLTLYVGQMVLVKMPGVARVAIGSGKVMEARVLDGANMLITAQDAGDSTLHVWERNGRVRKLQVRVNVVDLDRIAGELREITRGISGVGIRRIGERVILDGNNLDPAAVERLNTVAQLYAPAVVSLATADRIRVDRMIDIQVRIVEFSKTALDDLGVRWQSSGDGFNFGLFSDIASSGSYRVLPEGSSFNTSTPEGSALLSRNRRTPEAYFGIGMTLSSRINLLVQRGNAYLLASPNLSTRSGGEAKFLAGGEIPLPALSTQGAGSVEFKPYGVRLNIKPIADGEGNISGSILTEVSSIDRSVAVQGIPGLLIRRTDTEFNTKAGETIVLSGLLSRESTRASDGVPGLRKAPIIGRAFRADNDTDKEQEVVVFITPRVVDPAWSQPRIERARQIEQDVNRNFGTLTEDRTDPEGLRPKQTDVPATPDAGGVPAGVPAGTPGQPVAP